MSGNLPETTIQDTPIHASQLIRPRVRILAKTNPTIAATATKSAVHAPWFERAFKAVEMLIIADPAPKMKSAQHQQGSCRHGYQENTHKDRMRFPVFPDQIGQPT